MKLISDSKGIWSLISAHPPGRPAQSIGILLADTRTDELHVKVEAERWNVFGDDLEGEVWRELVQALEQQSREIGAAAFLQWLGDIASHVVQISEPQAIHVSDIDTELESLYERHVLAKGCEPEYGSHDAPAAVMSIAESKCTAALRTRRLAVMQKRRWAPIAVAAGLVSAALFGYRSDHQNVRSVHRIAGTGYMSRDPLSSLGPARFLLDVKSPRLVSPGTHRHSRKSSRLFLPPHKRLQPEFLTVRPIPLKDVQIAYPPPIEVAFEVGPHAWLPFSMPELPILRRRNPFVRFLAAFALPFRAVFFGTHSSDPTLSSRRM